MVTMRYPFLISVPHGGIEVPPEVSSRLALGSRELSWYCDPGTRTLFDFGTTVEVFIDTPVSRMVVDLNRPPLPLPPHDPDGIIKVRTIDGRPVYLPGQFPDITLIHHLLMKWYFPFHQQVDELIDRHGVAIAFDCHSMLPVGSREQKDAGQSASADMPREQRGLPWPATKEQHRNMPGVLGDFSCRRVP